MARSILFADDNPVIRRTLRSCFEQNGEWTICGEASDGQEAIVKAQELHPDLIILDLSMPVMNGLEAAKMLKRVSPTTPVLLFTSFKNPQLEVEAAAAGCSGVVAKSDVLLLFSSIQRLLANAN